MSFLIPYRGPDPMRRAFTLSGVLVAASVGMVLIAAVLSFAVLQARQTVSATALADMSESARRALLRVEADLRTTTGYAVTIGTTSSAKTVATLIVARLNSSGTLATQTITYRYEENLSDPTKGKLWRKESPATTETLLLSGVKSFRIVGLTQDDQLAATNGAVRKVVAAFTLVRGSGASQVSEPVVSALVLLRTPPAP